LLATVNKLIFVTETVHDPSCRPIILGAKIVAKWMPLLQRKLWHQEGLLRISSLPQNSQMIGIFRRPKFCIFKSNFLSKNFPRG